MDNRNGVWVRRLLVLLGVLFLIWGLYQVVSAINITQTTGILKAQASDKNAWLSISQDNHAAKIIGKGSAKVRLEPGVYYLAAQNGGSKATAILKIQKQKTANKYLKLSYTPAAPSVDSIKFEGINGLIDSGFSANQTDSMEQYLFRYKPTARKISIKDIDPQPRNPHTSVGFTTNVNVVIDSKQYKGVITRNGSDDLRLYLYDPGSGKLLFDSDNTQNPGG
jgi:hypothetical protein